MPVKVAKDSLHF